MGSACAISGMLTALESTITASKQLQRRTMMVRQVTVQDCDSQHT